MPDWFPLACLASRAPDVGRVVAWADGVALTHADFLTHVDRWQQAFLASPVASWAISLQDPFVFAAALFGAWHAGKSVVLPGDDRPATVAALRERGCGLAGDLPAGLQSVDSVAAPLVRQPLKLDEAALTVFTSGSQGQPQAIDKTLAPFWAEVQALEQTFGPACGGVDQPPATVWATVSHQHIYGLLFLVLWPLASGRPMARQRLPYPEDMIRALSAGPSVLVATPAHLKRLGDHLDWGAVRSHLRAVFSSGGPLPFEAAAETSRLMGRRPIEVLGSSETGGIAWRQAEQVSTPWRAFPDVQWRVQEGCLAVHSPRLPGDGWWVTSDRVEPDSEGGFRLLGRQDRIVKIEEKRVSLSAVEQALLATPWVADAKALVVSTPIGDRVGAVVVPSGDGQVLLAQGRRVLSSSLKEALAASLEPMAQPRRWRFVETLPLNAQGKTTQDLLHDLFLDDSPAPVAATVAAMPDVEWLERGAEEALAVLDIHRGLAVFDGHFPVSPILPGVAQLDWAISLGRQCFDLPETFERLEVLKFVSPVVPGTKLYLSLQRKAKAKEPDLVTLQFRMHSQGETAAEPVEHSSGRAVWRIAEGARDV